MGDFMWTLLNYYLCLIIALEKRKTMFTLHLSTISMVLSTYLLTYPLKLNTICLAGKTKGPSTYYASTFLDLFWPTNLHQQKQYWTSAKTCHFLDPPTQSFADVIYGWVPKLVKHVYLWAICTALSLVGFSSLMSC